MWRRVWGMHAVGVERSYNIPGASDARGKVDLVAQIALVLVRDEIRDAIAARGRNAARLSKYSSIDTLK